MTIALHNTTRQRIPTRLLQRAAAVFGRRMRAGRSSVSVVFVGETRMRTLNRSYRGSDRVTDVLSFSAADEAGSPRFASEAGYLGEVIICHKQIQRQARRQSIDLNDELVFIFVHGLLHLVGYEDVTAAGARKMEYLGTSLCKSINS